MARWVSDQDALDGWLTEQEALIRAAGGGDYPTCAHCEIDVDEAECIETPHGFLVCSTRCGAALETFGHREACRALECADNAVLTLPNMLCGLCDGPTPDGDTAHPGCREKIRNAFALQDGARLGATS